MIEHIFTRVLMRAIIIAGVIRVTTDSSCEDRPTEQRSVVTHPKKPNLQSDWIRQMQEISVSLLFKGKHKLQR